MCNSLFQKVSVDANGKSISNLMTNKTKMFYNIIHLEPMYDTQPQLNLPYKL